MKIPKHFLIRMSFLSLLFWAQNVHAQESDKQEILSQRKASNEALRNFDEELNASFSTEDAFITTGAGKLIAGNVELKQYLASLTGEKMYWIRTPDEVLVNSKTQLAWETGTWKGFRINTGETAVVEGKYSAMWTKASGIWLIKSQLFVTLE